METEKEQIERETGGRQEGEKEISNQLTFKH